MRFNELLLHKARHDGDPLLTLTSDKIRVRSFVEERAGPNTFFDFRRYEGYSLEEGLGYCRAGTVIKANNGSGKNMFFWEEPGPEDLAQARERMTRWLDPAFPLEQGYEPFYARIKPGVVVEDLLFSSEHHCFRFMTFGGRVEFVAAHEMTFADGGTRTLAYTIYDRTWRRTGVRIITTRELPDPEVERPASLEAMIQLAEALGQGLDYVRTDLFEVNGRIKFSEMTHVPEGGRSRYSDPAFEERLAALWPDSGDTAG